MGEALSRGFQKGGVTDRSQFNTTCAIAGD
jgi:hypothetical protein